MNIYEVLEYGPIVASNEEFGILITVNGSYFNLWYGVDGEYNSTDCYSLGADNGLYGLKIVDIMERASKILNDVINEVNNEE